MIAAMLAVAGGLARHVLCFRILWEATYGELVRRGISDYMIAPIAVSSPIEKIRPSAEVMKGVKAVPTASTTSHATRTLAGP